MDFDLQTTIHSGFTVSLGQSPKGVTGNRKLVNRFEITFLTNTRVMKEGENYVFDRYGGNAAEFIDKPQILNDPRNISLGIATAIEQTVKSILSDQASNSIPNTEKLASASLLGLSVANGVIVASILIVPVETETYDDLVFNLPITRYEA